MSKKYLKDNPMLMSEYDFDKNADTVLDSLTLGMEKKVWWKCRQCGYSWNTQIYLRAHGSGCPKCRKKETAEKRRKDKIKNNGSLKENFPTIARQWNYEKNDALVPENINPNTNKKVWWKCEKGHEWEAAVAKRTLMGRNCPICSNQKIVKGINDIPTINPILAREWNFEKNRKLDINSIGVNSAKKAWWKCEKGHEWEATVASRNHGNGCPVCANRVIIPGDNDLATKAPGLLKDWDYRKNKIHPTAISPGSAKRVYWQCNKCKHQWSTPVSERAVRGVGCPKCSSHRRTSFAEKAVYYYISQIETDAVENYKADFLGASEIDIFMPQRKIGIEYDGVFWHKKPERDIKKDAICTNNGIELYRIRELGCPIIESTSICIIRENESNLSLNYAIKELLERIFDKKHFDVDVDRDRAKINNLITFQEKQKSLRSENPELANEWCYEENGNLTPENTSCKSGRKVWWRCRKCKNTWEATIASRSQGNGCPYCSNRIILKGFNDLLTICPTLKDDWDYELNSISPETIGAGTAKKVFWKCHICGHNWAAAVNSRVSGNKCPKCHGKAQTTKDKK